MEVSASLAPQGSAGRYLNLTWGLLVYIADTPACFSQSRFASGAKPVSFRRTLRLESGVCCLQHIGVVNLKQQSAWWVSADAGALLLKHVDQRNTGAPL